MNVIRIKNLLVNRFPALVLLNILTISVAFGQSYITDINRDSAHSDKRTGGVIEKAEFQANEPNIKVTLNVPSFQMTLWQNGKEIKTYPVGLGIKDHPTIISLLKAKSIIWNPSWFPPNNKWVKPSLRGKVILPTDVRNPLGKVKIPLGYNYLIHQAKGRQDLGNLVSHGCVRVLKGDLYDLAEKIIVAQNLKFSADKISKAKNTKKTFVVKLSQPLQIEITYDTLVVKNGKLHIYPDVYSHKKNTVENLRNELETNNIDHSSIPDTVLKEMLEHAKTKKQYVIGVDMIRIGNFADGKTIAVLRNKTKPKKRIKLRHGRLMPY